VTKHTPGRAVCDDAAAVEVCDDTLSMRLRRLDVQTQRRRDCLMD
jgi:hypothetical protein